MIKKLATIGAAAALFAASALPAFAVPPGPPGPAATGCPANGAGPLVAGPALSPDLATMRDGVSCPVPAGFVPTVGP